MDLVFYEIVNGSSQDVIDAFTTYKSVLQNYLRQADIDDVINGVIRPTAVRNNSTGSKFMIFGSGSSEYAYEFVY